MKKHTIEIEDYFGNTLFAFEIGVNGEGELEIFRTMDCSLADVDGDYIFETDNTLYRMQSDLQN